MIQRVQSIWLLLAALCAFITYKMVLYIGTLPDGTERRLVLGDNFLLVGCIIALGALSLISIFLFRNRKAQLRFTILTMVLTIGFLFLEYLTIETFKRDNVITTGSYQVAALLPVVMVILLIFAARGIYKDQKLVKSLDRLR